jgi:hypothetical protein
VAQVVLVETLLDSMEATACFLLSLPQAVELGKDSQVQGFRVVLAVVLLTMQPVALELLIRVMQVAQMESVAVVVVVLEQSANLEITEPVVLVVVELLPVLLEVL